MATNPLDKVYLSTDQNATGSEKLDTLVGGGSITSGSDTYTADETAIYLVDDVSAIETYTISSWTALSSSSPYTYQATVTATATIGANTIVELFNDQAVLFATYGFAIGSVSGQNITIYSIGEPSSSVTLKVGIGG